MSENLELMTITRQQHENLMQIAETNRQMAVMLQLMGSALAALNNRLTTMERVLGAKVTISGQQAKALQKCIRERARAVCEKYDLSYQQDGKRVRTAILHTVLAQYAVKDVHDTPAAYYDLAISLINTWTSFQLIRQIRESHNG